nr:JmjC domain-containing protein [Tanacetum cinerariifolium]
QLKSKLKELDLDADAQTFIKVVSNEDSKDEAPLLWFALVGWKVITTPLGDINALYRIDRSTKHFTTLRQIFHMVDRQDLVISPSGASDNPAASTSVPADVPTSANAPTGSTSVLVDVPTSVAPAGVSNKGKSPMVEEDIPDKERTFKQMQKDRLSEQAAKRLHDEEQAQADWINIMAQVEANASLSKTLLGDDVSEDNFPARMAALIKRKQQALTEKLAKARRNRPMTQGQQRTYMRQIVKNQSSAIQAFSRTLKRTCPVLEEPSSKRQKSTEAPIASMPEVPQSPVVFLPKSSSTRKKSLGRKRLPQLKSKLKELDLDADAQTFIK